MKPLFLFFLMQMTLLLVAQDSTKFEIYTDAGLSVPVSTYSYHSGFSGKPDHQHNAYIEAGMASTGWNYSIGGSVRLGEYWMVKLRYLKIHQKHVKPDEIENVRISSWSDYDYKSYLLGIGREFKLKKMSLTPGINAGFMRSPYTGRTETIYSSVDTGGGYFTTFTSTTIGTDQGYGVPILISAECAMDICFNFVAYANLSYLYAWMLWKDVGVSSYISGPPWGSYGYGHLNYIKYYQSIQFNLGVKFKF